GISAHAHATREDAAADRFSGRAVWAGALLGSRLAVSPFSRCGRGNLGTNLEFVGIHPCRKPLAMRSERCSIECHSDNLFLRAELDQRLTEKIERTAVARVVQVVAVDT